MKIRVDSVIYLCYSVDRMKLFMTKEIYNLFADNKPLPKGTRIKTTNRGIETGGTHELSEDQLKSANRCPNHMSDYVPFWILGWKDLHDSLLAPHTQKNLDAFYEQLKKEYEILFEADPDYAYSKSKMTAGELARKMTLALDSGSGNKDGEGIKRTCKHFGINHTYKAIREFLNKV